MLMAHYHSRAMLAGLVGGRVAGAVVDDDSLEPSIARHLIQDATDLPGFVEGRDDDRDDWFQGGIRLRLGRRRHVTALVGTSTDSVDAGRSQSPARGLSGRGERRRAEPRTTSLGSMLARVWVC